MMKTLGMAMLVFGMFFAVVGSKSKVPATQAKRASPRSAAGARELILDLGNNATMKLVHIPAGRFLMGSPKTEKGRNKNEVQHEVTISKPLYMGVTHVTVDQFAAFVKDSGYQTDAEKDGGSFGIAVEDGKLDIKRIDGCSWRKAGFDQQGDHPVVQVSWNDAKAFCDWLSKKSGETVVLPTEAQWEYACRAGTTTAYPWGDNPDDGKGWANGADQSFKKSFPNTLAEWTVFNWDDGFAYTSPAGSFRVNAFGLYDMNGNAWQWCQDYYGDYETGAVTDPRGTASAHVLRGGSWVNYPAFCRSASRYGIYPDSRASSYCGLRVVVEVGRMD